MKKDKKKGKRFHLLDKWRDVKRGGVFAAAVTAYETFIPGAYINCGTQRAKQPKNDCGRIRARRQIRCKHRDNGVWPIVGGILNRSASFLLGAARGGTFYLLLSVLLGNPTLPRSPRASLLLSAEHVPSVCRKKRKICSSAARKERRNETIMYLQAAETAEYKYT